MVLAYNRHLGMLENYWMADHMHCPVDAEPLLVIDTDEHSSNLSKAWGDRMQRLAVAEVMSL